MDTKQAQISAAKEKFAALLESEYARIERMKASTEVTDFTKLEKIIVGVLPGDGIGPIIMEQALRVLHLLFREEIASGRIEVRIIEGMTIERRAELKESLPADVLEAVKACHVLLKGPMVTPRAGDPWPNLISANSLLRRNLELYAAVRPIRIPEKGIDWTFFRENIEGEYIFGNKGITVSDDLFIDFKVATRPGCERIARAAFDYARKNGKHNVTAVSKANIVKLTDGQFLSTVHRIGETEYPDIEIQERLVDAMCAKMMDEEFTKGCEVFVMQNLYGDIVTDIAAEYQGGLGSASSSNLGDRWAMFEAIHGTAPYLISHGRGEYADPCSLIRAVGMLAAHIGFGAYKALLDEALDVCTVTERRLVITTQKTDASAREFTDYLLETIERLSENKEG